MGIKCKNQALPPLHLQQMKGEGAMMLKKKFSPGCAHTKVLSVAPSPAAPQAALILYIKGASKYTHTNALRLKTVSLVKHIIIPCGALLAWRRQKSLLT
jgi:hypothetical protein